MSVSDGRHVMATCRCPRCHRVHSDLVPTRMASRNKAGAVCKKGVVCDHCYQVAFGHAAFRVYEALRAVMKG